MSPASFAGLVKDAAGRAVPVKRIGTRDFYVVTEDGFDYHIEADKVDAAVWARLKASFQQLKGDLLPKALEAMGQGDPFTVAAYEAAIDKIGQPGSATMLPEHRDLLAMIGFHIVIDYHGDVQEVRMPEQAIDPDDDEF